MTLRFRSRRRRPNAGLVAAAIGAVTGVRSTAAMTALTRGASTGPLARRLLARGSELLTSGEFVADKAADLPARTRPAPLIARVAIGGIAAGLFGRRRGVNAIGAAAIGALTAGAATFAATELRRTITSRTRIPDAAVGLAEDAIVLAGSAWIARSVTDGQR
jgi:uncharacterized membrane protein